jgi:hypothetical protein
VDTPAKPGALWAAATGFPQRCRLCGMSRRTENLFVIGYTKRRNPVIFATCLSAGLNIMRSWGETNISGATYINSLNLENTLYKYDLSP